jgi:hypothetical protein
MLTAWIKNMHQAIVTTNRKFLFDNFRILQYMKPLLNELSSKYTARRLRGHDLNLQSSKLI